MSRIFCVLFSMIEMLGGATGCKRANPLPQSATTQNRAIAPTIASLVPAATDLLIGMGATDHLVAISNWDAPRTETQNLPRAGDYRTIDWERLAALRPNVIVVQFGASKIPAGLRDQAAELNATIVNVTDNSLADVYTTIAQLGDACGESQKAAAAAAELKAALAAVHQRVAGETTVRTLITRSEPSNDLACVGGGNFIDDLLTLAGGENVLGGGDNSYPSIDREKLLALNPQAVLALLPGASPRVIDQAKQFWKSVPQIDAVRDGRVFFITDASALLPGFSISRIADQFATKLHPNARAALPLPVPRDRAGERVLQFLLITHTALLSPDPGGPE